MGKHTVKFGRQRSHYKATLRHLVSGLIINKDISTTRTRAKEVSRLAERLVTMGKDKNIASQRRAYSVLRNRDLVSILFDEIAPLFKDRHGGYTRVILTGRRRGDNAQMAVLEFVEKPQKEAPKKKEKQKETQKKKEKPIQVEPTKIKVKKKEGIEKTRPQKEEVARTEIIREKQEPKRISLPPEEPKKPKEEEPKPGFFKKILGRFGKRKPR